MRRRLLTLLAPALLAGCQLPAAATAPPAATHDGPAPTTSESPAPTTGATPQSTHKKTAGAATGKTPGKPAASAPAGKAHGALLFDPFDTIRCTWVPNLFVDLGAGAGRPGIDLRIPLWASRLDRTVKVRLRAEVNGTGYRTTASVTAGPPEWRGAVHLSFPAPENGDTISVATQLDTGDALAGTTPENSRRTVEGRLPSPLPTGEQSFACPRVN